jgi:hypothetical protein
VDIGKKKEVVIVEPAQEPFEPAERPIEDPVQPEVVPAK